MNTDAENSPSAPEEICITYGRLLLTSFLLILVIIPLLTLLFQVFWERATLQDSWDHLYNNYFLLIVLLAIVTHELVHGIMYAWLNPQGFKAVHFGVKWKWGATYCTCTRPVRIDHYRWVGAMPLITQGVLPLIVGLILGDGIIYCMGIIMTVAATGDMVMLYLLRNTDSHKYALDYRDKLGCQILDSADPAHRDQVGE